MNQRISDHDIYRIKDGTWEEYSVGPNSQRKIKTKNYNCKEERDMEQTTCLNHFYISKLNCTFPWLKSTKQSQEKCGSKHFIRDLVNLVEFVATGKYISRNIKEIRYVFYVLNFVHFLTGNNLPLKVEECLLSFFLTLSFYCVFFYTSSQVRCIFQYIHSWMYFFSNFLHF